MGSRPDGDATPYSRSAIAAPPCSPGSHAYSSADACSAIQPSACARPLITTTTVGVPQATTASTSSCCTPGSPRSVTSRNSPLVQFGMRPDRPPTTHTATLALRATATASPIPAVSVLRTPQPLAYATSCDARARRPASGVTDSG